MTLSDFQKNMIKLMLKGYGYSAAKHEFTTRERKEIQELIDNKLCWKGYCYPSDSTGMYYIPNDKREEVEGKLNNP